MAMADLRLVSAHPLVAHVMAIKAMAEPQTLPRILGVVAQFQMVPSMFCCQRDGDYLCVDIQFDGTDTNRIDLLLAKMRSMVVVQRANLMVR